MQVRFVLVALVVLGSSCTGSTSPGTTATPEPSATASPAPSSSSPVGPAPIGLEVVAAIAPGGGAAVLDDQTYLDGMRLAVDEVNADGGIEGRSLELRFHDDGGDSGQARRIIDGLLDGHPAAILYVGPGQSLTPLRTRFAQIGTPVILLQGDLYTSDQLFPQAFQTTVPWVWQARVITKYLVTDRGARRIGFGGIGSSVSVANVAESALDYWGGPAANPIELFPSAESVGAGAPPLEQGDAVILQGPPSGVAAMAAVSGGAARPPRIVAAADLLAATGDASPHPPAGTTACYTYTWAGWASPIPRVAKFQKSFEATFGHPPVGLEQEGYDAVRALVLGLERDGGEGGSKLVGALETIKETSFSSFPIDLGPDDHLFLPRDELGLFAVPGPHERLDPWQHRSDPNLWRPIMRTFTYDGERDNIIDQDRPVFFPGWKKNQPGPYYWESRYGIVSRPEDPLH
jgi:ABC-type branched-subunit amino acid transport system substrate-binding protein